MLFSYYFDAEKTHLLDCKFQVLQFTEKAEGVIEIMFSAEMIERMNGGIRKREAQVATFNFPPTAEGQTKHDIDFTRVRIYDQKKWVFTVINNKDAKEKVSVGLISNTANKNPLGLDVYHDDDQFNVELKANNLSILESEYTPPILLQTLVSANFEKPGYPDRFNSLTGVHDAIGQNYRVKEFIQDLLEPVPEESPFKIQLDIAPETVNPAEHETIFTVKVPKLGTFSVHKTGMTYLIEGGRGSDSVRADFPVPIAPQDFYLNHSMTTKAKFKIEGDGIGNITFTYNDTVLQSKYDHHNATFSSVEFRGAFAGEIL